MREPKVIKRNAAGQERERLKSDFNGIAYAAAFADLDDALTNMEDDTRFFSLTLSSTGSAPGQLANRS
jgi:hypothetical protein